MDTSLLVALTNDGRIMGTEMIGPPTSIDILTKAIEKVVEKADDIFNVFTVYI